LLSQNIPASLMLCHVSLFVRTVSWHGVAMLIYKILLPSEWAEFEAWALRRFAVRPEFRVHSLLLAGAGERHCPAGVWGGAGTCGRRR